MILLRRGGDTDKVELDKHVKSNWMQRILQVSSDTMEMILRFETGQLSII